MKQQEHESLDFRERANCNSTLSVVYHSSNASAAEVWKNTVNFRYVYKNKNGRWPYDAIKMEVLEVHIWPQYLI